MGLEDIPKWASPALQGLAFWLGYQHAYGIAERLSEGAIATEFLRLMVAHCDSNRALESEVLYRHVPEVAFQRKSIGSCDRADLVVATTRRKARNLAFPPASVEAIIEVKHNRSQFAKVWEDIDRLGQQRKLSKARIRCFLIYASVAKRPRFTDDSGAATSRIATSPCGTRYKIRRVCRATSRIPSKNPDASGHYAILIEVI